MADINASEKRNYSSRRIMGNYTRTWKNHLLRLTIFQNSAPDPTNLIVTTTRPEEQQLAQNDGVDQESTESLNSSQKLKPVPDPQVSPE
uniref:Uncharacterized protein n=1 Tax=Syphacia muris TaxID=451379 RepID=A0A0N5AZY0_9BILA